MNRLNFSMGDIVRDNVALQVELYATGVRWFKFRAWLGSIILRLGARVIGCSIEIKRP